MGTATAAATSSEVEKHMVEAPALQQTNYFARLPVELLREIASYITYFPDVGLARLISRSFDDAIVAVHNVRLLHIDFLRAKLAEGPYKYKYRACIGTLERPGCFKLRRVSPSFLSFPSAANDRHYHESLYFLPGKWDPRRCIVCISSGPNPKKTISWKGWTLSFCDCCRKYLADCELPNLSFGETAPPRQGWTYQYGRFRLSKQLLHQPGCPKWPKCRYCGELLLGAFCSFTSCQFHCECHSHCRIGKCTEPQEAMGRALHIHCGEQGCERVLWDGERACKAGHIDIEDRWPTIRRLEERLADVPETQFLFADAEMVEDIPGSYHNVVKEGCQRDRLIAGYLSGADYSDVFDAFGL